MNIFHSIIFNFSNEVNALIYIYANFVWFIAVVLLLLAFLLSNLKKPSILQRTEGFEVYEFGATSIGSSSLLSSNKFYYILATLFIIFDIELMILFPYELFYKAYLVFGNNLILTFLILLMLGYSYELASGALSWYRLPAEELGQRFGWPEFLQELMYLIEFTSLITCVLLSINIFIVNNVCFNSTKLVKNFKAIIIAISWNISKIFSYIIINIFLINKKYFKVNLIKHYTSVIHLKNFIAKSFIFKVLFWLSVLGIIFYIIYIISSGGSSIAIFFIIKWIKKHKDDLLVFSFITINILWWNFMTVNIILILVANKSDISLWYTFQRVLLNNTVLVFFSIFISLALVEWFIFLIYKKSFILNLRKHYANLVNFIARNFIIKKILWLIIIFYIIYKIDSGGSGIEFFFIIKLIKKRQDDLFISCLLYLLFFFSFWGIFWWIFMTVTIILLASKSGVSVWYAFQGVLINNAGLIAIGAFIALVLIEWSAHIANIYYELCKTKEKRSWKPVKNFFDDIWLFLQLRSLQVSFNLYFFYHFHLIDLNFYGPGLIKTVDKFLRIHNYNIFYIFCSYSAAPAMGDIRTFITTACMTWFITKYLRKTSDTPKELISRHIFISVVLLGISLISSTVMYHTHNADILCGHMHYLDPDQKERLSFFRWGGPNFVKSHKAFRLWFIYPPEDTDAYSRISKCLLALKLKPKIFAGKRKLQLFYLNFNIISSYFVSNLIINWDDFLYKSQFQFSSNTLTYSLKGAIFIQITNDLTFPTTHIGYDFFSLLLTAVTSIIFPLALLSNWNSNLMHSISLFLFCLSWVEGSLFLAFASLDLFIFYISFEGIAIPTFFLIYLFGSELTKIKASLVFLISSFLSSAFITIALLCMYSIYKLSGIIQILLRLNFDSSCKKILAAYCDSRIVCTWHKTKLGPFCFINQNSNLEYFIEEFTWFSSFNTLTSERTIFIWVTLFLGFAFKLPICPFHMWLPEAHAEAPTAGSVILAGCILKLGSFGLFRYFIPMFIFFNLFSPLVFTCCLVGVLFTSYVAIRVNHIKQLIAYSSIGHMGSATIGLFSGCKAGIGASLYNFLQHSITSSGFFILAGILYDRYEAYENYFYTGLSRAMPLFTFCDMAFLLANLPFPFFGGFASEINFLTVLWRSNFTIIVILLVNQILTATQIVFYVHKMLFTGSVLNFNEKIRIIHFVDLVYRELLILILLLSLTVSPGQRADLFINLVDSNYQLYVN